MVASGIKKVYPHQMWLDGLFMGTRFYAAYEKEYNDGAVSMILSISCFDTQKDIRS
jgi:hypothetical protein